MKRNLFKTDGVLFVCMFQQLQRKEQTALTARMTDAVKRNDQIEMERDIQVFH